MTRQTLVWAYRLALSCPAGPERTFRFDLARRLRRRRYGTDGYDDSQDLLVQDGVK